MTEDAGRYSTRETYEPPPGDDDMAGRFGGAWHEGAAARGGGEPKSEPIKFTATPFVWSDPALFPRRRWLYGRHLIRGYVSTTLAPGGVGKTSLTLVEAVALATGRPLLGIVSPEGPRTVWFICLEDPREELQRRVLGILEHYRIDPAELGGRLFLDSGRDLKMIVVKPGPNGAEIAEPVVDALVAEIRARNVDLVTIDPFVKVHRLNENDNTGLDVVVTAFADVAHQCQCAVEIVHHVRKLGGAEATVEDGRGASSVLGAVRSARVLNRMTKEEGEKAGGADYLSTFRATNGKSNMAPPAASSDWFRLLDVSLGNGSGGPFDDGDRVQVVVSWQWPDLMETVKVSDLPAVQRVVAAGQWRAAVQAKAWVGVAVAQVMKLDHTNKAHRAIINAALSAWYGTRSLVKVVRQDEHREDREFVEVGPGPGP
jgi:hypothetical protein